MKKKKRTPEQIARSKENGSKGGKLSQQKQREKMGEEEYRAWKKEQGLAGANKRWKK